MALPSFMQGKVDVPVLGSVPKGALIGIGGAAAAFIAWKWWQSSMAAPGGEEEPEDPGFGDGEVLPEVENAYPSDNSFGIGKPPPTPDDYGFTGTRNTEWTQYVTTRLTQSARWEYTDIVTALGNYLNRKPLTTEQVAIVQAAIAEGGYPPEGSYTIITGGSGGGGADTPITVAPTGVKVVAKDSSTLTVTWQPVAGASSYRLYRSDVTQNVGTSLDTTAEVGGLRSGIQYGISVAAVDASDKTGPKSAVVKGTTKGATLKAPTGVKVKAEPNGVVWVYWNAVPGAEFYRVYHDRSQQNVSDSRDTKARIGGLKQKTKYRFHVRAVSGNTTGPASSSVSVTTRSK